MANKSSGNLAGAHIKVTPEVLSDKSGQVLKCVNNMANTFQQLETVVNRTSYYWIGEAGDLHRKLYNQQKSTIDEMMQRLREHPRDLITIAQIYSNVEKEVESIAIELPGDVIE